MLPLHELQLRFAAALFGDSADPIAQWIREDGIEPEGRIDIYRNNLQAGFAKALALEFPVIERLVGCDYFGMLAREFQADHPSRSGNLHHIGRPFSSFLRGRLGATQYSYLSDIAALEWACQESLLAADAQPLEISNLQDLCPEDYARLVFTLHPTCRLVRTGCPAIRIWRSNQPGVVEPEVIDLGSAADRILVRRSGGLVEFYTLPAGRFALLEAIQGGRPLGEAVDTACAADGAFDLAEALRQLFALGLFTGFTVTDPSGASGPPTVSVSSTLSMPLVRSGVPS